MEKFISLFLIVAYVQTYIGCTHWIKKEEFDSTNNTKDIRVQTQDSSQYLFEDSEHLNKWYNFKNDTILGMGSKLIPDTILNYRAQIMRISLREQFTEYVEIPFDQILNIEVKEFDLFSTLIAIGFPIATITILAFSGYFDLEYKVY